MLSLVSKSSRVLGLKAGSCSTKLSPKSRSKPGKSGRSSSRYARRSSQRLRLPKCFRTRLYSKSASAASTSTVLSDFSKPVLSFKPLLTWRTTSRVKPLSQFSGTLRRCFASTSWKTRLKTSSREDLLIGGFQP